MEAANEFPETLQSAMEYFADESNAFAFMRQVRWPDGVAACPRCQSSEVSFISTRKVWECKYCKVGKQFSIKVGTIFEDSPIRLGKWWCAIWLISNAKNGISSCEIGRALGVTQKTAWFMLQRIRLALQSGSIMKLRGTIEADETFVGGKAVNMHKRERAEKIKGRGASGKAVVMGVLSRATRKNASKVHAMVVKNTDRESLLAEIEKRVAKGSAIYTDAHHAYGGLDEAIYTHEAVDHAIEYVRGKVHTNGLENFWCLLKRALKGTYVSVNAEHLFRYLDEQSFRFNERKLNDAGRFLKAVAGIIGRRLTYLALTSNGQCLQT
ncbi:MAG: IS1595 family transposase [Verrucomicrobia bacterium]|nr:IS1595 family transposase [Acidobacteriota bacterium]MBV9658860.1 IS1595 family transposase [Verrucomicrobiota bacterium]